MIRIKRAYDEPDREDGYRILVDRLWPRGISKEQLKADLWLREVAPSNELRKWFNHDPAKWEEFKKRYRQELAANPAFDQLKEIIKKEQIVTVLFGAADTQHNQAIALKEFLES
jgi:uncharacterized protein YeaO (DUF488 family)